MNERAKLSDAQVIVRLARERGSICVEVADDDDASALVEEIHAEARDVTCSRLAGPPRTVVVSVAYSYCETVAAVGLWHIRRLSEKGRKPSGGADTKTLCGLQAAWDVPSSPVPFEFRPHDPLADRNGDTCKLCSKAFSALPDALGSG